MNQRPGCRRSARPRPPGPCLQVGNASGALCELGTEADLRFEKMSRGGSEPWAAAVDWATRSAGWQADAAK